ncbi:GAF domain-containing protein [Haloplanus salilacus]|uniref:GAF domain-containing protein n=1 Tax=Haloplanus salilacus TaxID=2949994 RepID=UPI0030D5BE43
MHVFCIDPDDESRRATRDALHDAGFDVSVFGTAADALDALDTTPVDCVVTEYDLPDGTGIELLDAVRDQTPDAACMLFTDASLETVDTEAFGDTVAEYLPKGPSARDRLPDLIRHSVGFRSQTAYPLPDDEDGRLAALDRYVEDANGVSATVDRLSRLAIALFDVRSAAIGFVDAHHEDFLACYGTGPDSLNREDTVCTYSILDDGVTVVEDVHDDPRFADNERLVEADIRFYAGAPLVTPDGHAIGVFCLHDAEPRSFSGRERELLAMLADETMEIIELRRQVRDATGGGVDG